MHQFVSELMLHFDGFRRAHGTYSRALKEEDGGKLKGRAATLNAEVTVELWMRHLTGEQGLGIIPINEASEVKFAAIDVDEYPIDLEELNQRIQKNKLPLILCRTKSGGAHLFMFLTKFHDAGAIQRKMREFASLLGYGNSEIYPKQTKIQIDRGDAGSWINMPYFDHTSTTRYALGESGKRLDLRQFVDYIRVIRIPPEDLLAIKTSQAELLPGGPPCLNHLASMGFPAGTRNLGLFNLGVYARKLNPDNWQALVEQYNQKLLDPPLDTVEVLGIIKSLQRKDFQYLCKQPPIAQYCNAPRCRACKYGVGGGHDIGMPTFGSLTKLMTDPPIWFLEVEGGGRLELTTEELQSQRSFQLRCMEALNVMPVMPKNEVWQEVIHRLLEDVNLVPAPEEASPAGQLTQHIEDFCTSRVQAKTADELLLGKPWTWNGRHYFRMKDLLAYLERVKFRLLRENFIVMHIKMTLKGEPRFWNLRGKGVNTISIPEFENKQTENIPPPAQSGPVPY